LLLILYYEFVLNKSDLNFVKFFVLIVPIFGLELCLLILGLFCYGVMLADRDCVVGFFLELSRSSFIVDRSCF